MRESSWREQEALEARLRQTEQARTSLLASQSSLRSSLQQHQAVLEETDAQREKETGHMSSLEVSSTDTYSSGCRNDAFVPFTKGFCWYLQFVHVACCTLLAKSVTKTTLCRPPLGFPYITWFMLY